MLNLEFLDIPALNRAEGHVRLPGSKSISNRVLLLAALSRGQTVLRHLLHSDDTAVMLAALRELGCQVEGEGAELKVTGWGEAGPKAEAALFLGNAGTAMRPLTAALALLAQRHQARYELSGVARMHERPIGDLVDALRPLGCVIDYLGQEGFPPLRLSSGPVPSVLPEVRVRGDVSSQFLTGLLMALPLVAHDRDVVVAVEGELISKPYIEITLALLARFGVQVRREGWSRFTIPAGSQYVSPGEVDVEGDASGASYFIATGAIAGTGEGVRIDGVGSASVQGDVAFADAARAMGAHIEMGPDWMQVRRGQWPLKAIEWDCVAIPDAAMTLASMACFAEGRTVLRGIQSWRVKETDRIAAMAAELRKLGATVEEGPDWIAIEAPKAWQHAVIHTYDDHRIAMCLSLTAFNRLAGGSAHVRILDPKCTAKTYPTYFEHWFGVVSGEPAGVPVLAVDGPTASGKGTLAAMLAHRLGYHLLDSGALYRTCALAALNRGLAADDEPALTELARHLPVRFDHDHILLDGRDVSHDIRGEQVGMMASKISSLPGVRQGLHELQLSFRKAPGLVADGRDMGTVVFPEAGLKVFLTASAEKRAERRFAQLQSKGVSANLDSLRSDLEARDARDMNRATAPLKPAEDAMLLDNSSLSIKDTVDQVLGWWAARRPF